MTTSIMVYMNVSMEAVCYSEERNMATPFLQSLGGNKEQSMARHWVLSFFNAMGLTIWINNSAGIISLKKRVYKQSSSERKKSKQVTLLDFHYLNKKLIYLKHLFICFFLIRFDSM